MNLIGYKSEHYLRHKNRAKYIENFHLYKEQAEKQSKKKIENEQEEGNIDERRAKI